MSSEFIRGDLVWAKMRYYPAWPARVIDPPEGKLRKKSYYVYFFGTKNAGWVKREDVCSYKMNYTDLFKRGIRNQTYTNAVKKIGEIYHEEFQLKSPTFKRMKMAEQAENDEEPEEKPEANYENGCYFKNSKKPQQTKEERQKKIQERLKVRLFPEKGKNKDKKNKRKNTNKDEKSVISAAKDASPSQSSSIPSSSPCIPSSSSCIITVHVRDYKKVIPHEVVVLLRRYDAGLPSLTNNADEQSESECPPDQPPTLLPEL